MSARVVILDIETQRAQVETFNLFPKYIHIDRVIRPARILCFAAKWRDSDKVIFKSAWRDDDEAGYEAMIRSAWGLLNDADVVVTWNGDRFDLQWFNAEFLRLGLPRPTPYKSVDLIKVVKKHFRQGLMSMKLDWSARQILGDRKVPHSGSDLWSDIRYGSRDVRRAACALMKRYCVHDVELTADLFEKHLPWTNLNLALWEDNDDELLHCTKCNSTSIKRDGKRMFATTGFLYQMYRCKECGASSRGKRFKGSTELRPVG